MRSCQLRDILPHYRKSEYCRIMNCKINYNYTFTPKTNITNVEINCWICPGRPGSAALGNCTVTATLQETQSSHCDESDVQSTIVNLHNNSHTVSSDAAHQNCDASVTAAALNGRKLTPPASERKKMMTNLIKRPPVDIRYENLVKNLFQSMFFRTNQVFLYNGGMEQHAFKTWVFW